MNRRLACLTALLCLLVPSAAQAATSDEVVALLESASQGDGDALEQARDVDFIDGVPTDVAALLEASRNDPSLAAGILRRPLVVDPGPQVAETVASLLSQERFAGASTGLLERWLERIGSWIANRLTQLSGGSGTARRANILALAAVLALVAVVTALATRRRAAVLHRRATLDRLIEDTGDDPVEIERAATAAAERGDYTRSVRLRFIAGILRLDQQGVIHYTKGLTTGAIAEVVDDPRFDSLQDDFDRVVYGDEPADLGMEQRSESIWRRLLQEARRA